MSVQQYLPIGSVARRPDARPIVDADVAALMASIRELGLLNPISCRVVGEGYEVIAGSNRLEAIAQLGEREILATILDLDDDHAELAMIDENLCRAELSPADRAAQMARRKAIYEKLHPETRPVTERGGPGRGKTTDNLSTVSSFADATAAAIGKDARSVRRDAERGEKVIDEVLDMIRGTKLDTGAYLDKLKRLPPNDQVHAAKRDLSIERREERLHERRSSAAPPVQPKGARAAAIAAPSQPAAGRTFEIYKRAMESIDGILEQSAAETAAGCPPRERAKFCQRLSSLVDFANDLLEAMAK